MGLRPGLSQNERSTSCSTKSKRHPNSPDEWLARLADHIPDPGKHRTHFYAHYANRVRGERPSEELGSQKHEEEQLQKRRCSPAHRQGLSGGSARLPPVRGEAEDH